MDFREKDILKVRCFLVPSCCFFWYRIIVLEKRKHSAVKMINISEQREPSRTPFLSPKSNDVMSKMPFDLGRWREQHWTNAVLTQMPLDPVSRAKPRTNPSFSFFFPPQIKPGSEEQLGHCKAEVWACIWVWVWIFPLPGYRWHNTA